MGRVHANERPSQTGEIVDFDAALFASFQPETRADLMCEAELLAGVFAPSRATDELLEMARQLSAGARDGEMDRAHARRLAATLKLIATPGATR